MSYKGYNRTRNNRVINEQENPIVISREGPIYNEIRNTKQCIDDTHPRMRRYSRKNPTNDWALTNPDNHQFTAVWTGVSGRSLISVTAVVALANGRKADNLPDAGNRVVDM